MLSNAKKLTELPTSPGVYFFKNTAGEIIYIGKAGNLRNRVKSYFPYSAKASQGKQKGITTFNPAKQKMLAEIANIEILKTESEIEALIKEAELIKKYKPKFNVLMRDSKNYLFAAFTQADFPKIILTHQKLPNTSFKIQDYTGPFTDGGAVRKSLHLLRNIFPYCTCKQKHQTKCLSGHLGRCLVFCCLKTSSLDISNSGDRQKQQYQHQYQKNVRAIRAILSGRSQVLLKELKKEIKIEIKKQNFERANELKLQINNLDEILKHAHVLTDKPELSPAIFKDDKPDFKLLGLKSNPNRIETYDISNIHGHEAVGSMVVFEQGTGGIYKPNKNEYRKFKIKTVKGINDPAMIAEILKRRLNNNWPLPQLIIIDGGRTQLNASLKSLGPQKIRMVGLAKKLEEIYLPERLEPMLAQKFGQSMKHLFVEK